MSSPDFFTALYAAVVSVRDGDSNEAEVAFEVADGDHIETLTVTIRRFEFDREAAD